MKKIKCWGCKKEIEYKEKGIPYCYPCGVEWMKQQAEDMGNFNKNKNE